MSGFLPRLLTYLRSVTKVATLTSISTTLLEDKLLIKKVKDTIGLLCSIFTLPHDSLKFIS
jgi:hypothetical protein